MTEARITRHVHEVAASIAFAVLNANHQAILDDSDQRLDRMEDAVIRTMLEYGIDLKEIAAEAIAAAEYEQELQEPGTVDRPREMVDVLQRRKAAGVRDPFPRGICATCGENVPLSRDLTRTHRHFRPDKRGNWAEFLCDGGIAEVLDDRSATRAESQRPDPRAGADA